MQRLLALLDPVLKSDERKLDRLGEWLQREGWQKLEQLALILATCVFIYWAIKLAIKAVRRAVEHGEIAHGADAKRRADTLTSVMDNMARVLIAAFFLVTVLSEFGVNIGPLLTGAGIAGLAVGFGAQALVKDMISGFFILMENQFSVGDIISVGTHSGTVERMTLRVTLVRDSEGKAHFIPNGAISDVVVMSKDFARALVEVDVAFGTDLEAAEALLAEIGKQLAEERPDDVLEPTDVKGVEKLSGSGITLRTLTKTAPGKQFEVARELRSRIAHRFVEAKIDIYPSNTVILKG